MEVKYSNTQLLSTIKEKYRLNIEISNKQEGPSNKALWTSTIKITTQEGSTVIGRSTPCLKKQSSKEIAAGEAIEWLDEYRYR